MEIALIPSLDCIMTANYNIEMAQKMNQKQNFTVPLT